MTKKRHTAIDLDDIHAATRSLKPSPLFRIALLTLAAAGIVVTAYLSYVASVDVRPAFCAEHSGCDLVQHSRWATFLGMPMATWGLFTYLVVAGLSWRNPNRPTRRTILIFVAIGGFAVSAYLTAVSVVDIGATCIYCLTSFGIITAIMALAIAQRPPGWFASVRESIVVAAIIVGGLHLHYSGMFDEAAGPENPQLRALAIHLTDTGAAFYGAHWCPVCQEQKALFTSSALRLPYVECSTGGQGSPLTAPCVANNVRQYPTWIIGEKRYNGIQKPRALAGASDFDWKRSRRRAKK